MSLTLIATIVLASLATSLLWITTFGILLMNVGPWVWDEIHSPGVDEYSTDGRHGRRNEKSHGKKVRWARDKVLQCSDDIDVDVGGEGKGDESEGYFSLDQSCEIPFICSELE
jgi:hypothetical protein